MKLTILYLFTLVATIAFSACQSPEMEIKWNDATRQFVSDGVYARIKPVGEKFALVYSAGPAAYIRWSDNKCKTWSKPKQLLSRAGGAPAHLFKLSTGELISTFSYRKAPCGIKVIISTDDGKTWCESKDIFVSDGDFWDIGYPYTVELNDGTLLTVFYIRPSGNKPAKIVQQRWKIEK
jgi:hypothetical protein